MNTKQASNAVTNTMLEVKTSFKEMLSSQNVEVTSMICPCAWPDHSLNVKDAQQHSCVGVFLEGCWCLSSKMATPSYIRGPIKILTS